MGSNESDAQCVLEKSKMRRDYWIAAIALTMAVGITANATAKQAAQPSHETKGNAKMPMSAMTDMEFAQMMTKHHQGAIEMAKLEESRGTRDEVKALAAKIREAQEREVKEMAHHASMPMTGTARDAAAGHEGHGAMMQKQHEMMQQQAMAAKKRIDDAAGAAVDQAFLEEMTKHHQMALEMISKAKLKDASLRKLSQKMAADQKRELGDFKKLKAR